MRGMAATGIVSFAVMAGSSPAAALTYAYALVEVEPGRGGQVMDGNWGFANCKGRTHSFRSDEIILEIACNDAPSLATVVTVDLPERAGVRVVTVWRVWNAP
jgi:hypothetical protein